MSEVYQSICAVMADLSIEGIGKNRKNTQGQGYKFRGIDDVYNVLSSILSKHQLVIIPRVLKREQVEREAKSGGALYYTAVDVEFDIVSAIDGSKHTARTCGEAMDSSDKSTNKAMSAAYKYMAFQTFCIPIEGDNDADAHTPIAAPEKSTPPIVEKRGGVSASQLKRAGSWESLQTALATDMVDVRSLVSFFHLKGEYRARAKAEGWPKAWLDQLASEFEGYENELRKQLDDEDVVSEIQNTFPGARVVSEHPLNAG